MSFGWGGKGKSDSRGKGGQFVGKNVAAQKRNAFLAPVQRWEKVWVTPETASVPGGSAGASGSANGYRVKKWVKVEELSTDQTEQDQAEAALNAAQSTSLGNASLAGLQMPGDATTQEGASKAPSRANTPHPPPLQSQPTQTAAQPPTASVPAESDSTPAPSQAHPSTFHPPPSIPASTAPPTQPSEPQPSNLKEQEDTDMTGPAEAHGDTEQQQQPAVDVTAPAQEAPMSTDEPASVTDKSPAEVADEERIRTVTTTLDEGSLAESAADLVQPPPPGTQEPAAAAPESGV